MQSGAEKLFHSYLAKINILTSLTFGYSVRFEDPFSLVVGPALLLLQGCWLITSMFFFVGGTSMEARKVPGLLGVEVLFISSIMLAGAIYVKLPTTGGYDAVDGGIEMTSRHESVEIENNIESPASFVIEAREYEGDDVQTKLFLETHGGDGEHPAGVFLGGFVDDRGNFTSAPDSL
jgi:hypothetical protein